MDSFEIRQIDSSISKDISESFQYLKYGWPSATGGDLRHWNMMIREIEPPYLFDMRTMPEWTEILEETYNAIGIDWPIQRAYVNGYTYGTDAGSHTDSHHLLKDVPMKTAIVYLNDEWDLDWGGETALFENGEIIRSVLPKPGRVFIFDSHMLHAARPLSKTFHGIRKILALKYYDPKYTTPFLQYLHDHTKGHDHSGRTFLHHLFSVAYIASKHKFDDDVIKACYFHSIYGTEYYKFDNEKVTRDDVRKHSGEKSESLVHEFCTLKNRTDTILKSDSLELKQIEYANLVDQNHDGRHGETLQKLHDMIFVDK